VADTAATPRPEASVTSRATLPGGGDRHADQAILLLADRRTPSHQRCSGAVLGGAEAYSRQSQTTLTPLVAEADARRSEGRPLASALRLLALQVFFLQPSISTAPSDR
jgi:hypothetical protein